MSLLSEMNSALSSVLSRVLVIPPTIHKLKVLARIHALLDIVLEEVIKHQ